MIDIINFIASIITKAVNVMNVKLFPDMPITYLQLLLACVVITMIFKLCFGGLKELDNMTNLSLNFFKSNKQSKEISNYNRKKQLNDNYIPRHAKRYNYVPRHAKDD